MGEICNTLGVINALQSITLCSKKLADVDLQRILSLSDSKVRVQTFIQLMFNLKFKNQFERQLYEIIVMHALAAERVGPGGFKFFLDELFKSISKTSRDATSHISHSPTSFEIDKLLNDATKCASSYVAPMLREAMYLAGYDGKIVVEKTSSTTPSIELVRGYTFNLQPLLHLDFSFVNPKVACIDGYVESVSELNQLLEAAAESKEPCVIFVRGIADDVKQTLKINFDRGNLVVAAMGVPFDLEGMNTLVDISVVSGCDLVSSLKGDLISTLKLCDLPYVDKVSVIKGRTTIISTSTARSVQSHLFNLRQRSELEQVSDIAKLINKRIRALSPNHVIIRLPDDRNHVINSQSLDYAIRSVRSALAHGLLHDGSIAASKIAAKTHAERCMQSLRAIGAIII